ncbi:MAG: GTPase Era [Bdellovibrionales bacterium RIFOXYD1_FULL_53_11]|nr:MAG: GTPase Era [Bdellovibrionales bacterium RIFOXYD1_FULL_53_11]
MPKSGYIAIIGRPNVGKSTLLCRVLGSEISIVTPKAQTTRERVLGILSDPARGQMVFIDTPGIHNAKHGGFNEFMVGEARRSVEEDRPSCVWYLADFEFCLKKGISFEDPVLDILKAAGCPVIIIVNKADKSRDPDEPASLAGRIDLQARDKGVSVAEVLSISAINGKGVGHLLELSWKHMPEGVPFYPDMDQLSDRPMRYFAAERIRQQLFLHLGEELPYCCAVRIDKFEENRVPVRIEATIFVERESQKGMVIGKGGAKLKAIGTAARKSFESFADQKIFLGLDVQTLKNWTRDKEQLRKLGYAV